jgi:hypothetical protein
MGLGHGVIKQEEGGLPHIDEHVNETLQLWQYQAWAELMAAESWDEWKKNHSIPGGTY